MNLQNKSIKNIETTKNAGGQKIFRAVKKELKKNGSLYLLAFIPFVFLILFHYWPMYGVQIAFKDYSVAKGIAGSPWVGLKHIRF